MSACPQQTGDGDLEELVEELNPGKVLYAYWRVVPLALCTCRSGIEHSLTWQEQACCGHIRTQVPLHKLGGRGGSCDDQSEGQQSLSNDCSTGASLLIPSLPSISCRMLCLAVFPIVCAMTLLYNRQVVKHVHVTINARNADDLEEEAVMKKIQLASGANYDAGSVRG